MTLRTREEIDDLVEVCIAAPMEGHPSQIDCIWGIPLLIEGEPGIAKSARVKQLAEVLVVKAASLFASQHPPEDFSSVLVADGKGGATQISPLVQVRDMIQAGTGIIFLDEINGAPKATQGALQSFVHERVAGDKKMPGKIRILAAQNPEDIATGGYRMSPPLANRFAHTHDPGPNGREWGSFMSKMGTKNTHAMHATLDQLDKAIETDWPHQYPSAVTAFVAFIGANPSMLHARPPLAHPQSGKAWPSHRTWDYATRLWSTSKILQKSDEVREEAVRACVGDAACDSFLSYNRLTDLPKPLDVLAGKWKIDTHRLDIVFAAYSGAMAYAVQAVKSKEKGAVGAWEALNRLFDANLADIVIPMAKTLAQAGLGTHHKNEEVASAARAVLVRMGTSGIHR